MPTRDVSLARFLQNFQGLWEVFSSKLTIKVGRFSQGVLELWGLKLRGAVSPKFSMSHIGNPNTFCRCKDVPKILYHEAKFGGTGTCARPVGEKCGVSVHKTVML